MNIDEKSKSLQTYSMLNLKMKEVEKKKKTTTIKSNQYKQREIDEYQPTKQQSHAPRKEKKQEDAFIDPNAPDRSYGDYFCKICDSHMNSDAMWEAHVTGKRHMKNVKKGDTDSKYEDLDVESAIKYELRNVKDPIIGLNYIHEIRRREPGVPAMYNCFLCCASLATVPLVIEHAIGLKHRMNFMRENNPKEYQLIEAAGLKKGQLDPLVAEKAAALEAEYGRGVVKVKKEKPKIVLTTYKRKSDDFDDVVEIPIKSSRSSKVDDSKNPSYWKSIDSFKKDYRDENSSRREKSSYSQHDDRSYDDRSYDDRSYDDDYKRSTSHRDSLVSDKDDYRRSHSQLSDNRDDYSRHSFTESYSKQLDDYSYTGRSTSESYLRPPISDDYSRPSSYEDDYYKRSEEFLRSINSPSRYKDQPRPSRTPERQSSGRPSDYTSSSQYDSRSYYGHDKTNSSAAAAPSSKTNNEQSSVDDSKNVLKDFVVQLTSLSKEYFFRIVLMKLQDMEPEGVTMNELEVLLKINNIAKQIISRNLPPQLHALLKDKFQISHNLKSSPGNSISSQNLPASQASSEIASNSMVQQKFTLNDINELLLKARQTSNSTSTNSQQQPQQSFNNANTGNVPPPPDFPLRNNMPPPRNFQRPPADLPRSSALQPVGFPVPNRYSDASNFTQPSNNASSYTPFSSYSKAPTDPSIPGLTLTDDSPKKPPFNEYPSQQSWPMSNANDPVYGRF